MADESSLSSLPNVGPTVDEFEALQAVIAALRILDPEARNRIFESAATFLGITPVHARNRELVHQSSSAANFFSTPAIPRAPFQKTLSCLPRNS